MYEVMKDIYEQNMPISFKGAMVLKAYLLEAGYTEGVRHTADIDANWSSEDYPSAEMMASSLQAVLDKAGIAADVQLHRMYGEGRSAGFTFTDRATGDELFQMDIDVNRPFFGSKIYEIEGLRFRGVSPIQMITDKISVISTDKVFRRIKDLVDLYYLSKVFAFDRDEIYETLLYNGKVLGNFQGILKRQDELKYAYDKFRLGGDVYKPPFDKVYLAVKSYLRDLLPREKKRDLER